MTNISDKYHNMKRELKFLNIPFQVKADTDDELVIEGNIDSAGDVIVDGAFKKTLSERAGRIAFCLQHDIFNPIGKILEIKEDEKGLFLKVRISDSEPDVKTKIREGILKEMSIGYSVMDAKNGEKDGKDVLFLTDIKLFEVSLVTVAANPEAMIEAMKAEGQTTQDVIEAEFDRLLALERNNEKKYEIMKLKALVMSLPFESKGTEKPLEDDNTNQDEPLKVSSNEILNILRNG
jgi:HK97 family phage prohead protease